MIHFLYVGKSFIFSSIILILMNLSFALLMTSTQLIFVFDIFTKIKFNAFIFNANLKNYKQINTLFNQLLKS
jgi:hypothetical protein